MRRSTLLPVLALLLAGCSDTPEEVRADYCESVAARQVELSEILAEESPATLLRALPVFRDLGADAPRDIEDDWARVIDALTALDEALDDAGVDAAAYDADRPPAEVTEAQQRAISRAADGVARPEVAAALAGVQQQAKDVCKTPLHR